MDDEIQGAKDGKFFLFPKNNISNLKGVQQLKITLFF